MDGTIYSGENLYHDVKELFQFFIKHNIRFYFLTNNSSKTSEVYLKKLQKLGIDFVKQQQIITSGDITVEYLKKHHVKKIYAVATPDFKNQLLHAGFELVNTKNEKIDMVVIGFDTTFDYSKGEIATHYLRKNAPVISTNEDLVCPIENDEFIPDCGAITKLLEVSSNRQTKYLGKPREETVNYLLNYTKIPKDELAIVGDRLYTDIATGFNNGFTSIAVLTGEFKKEDLKTSEVIPSYIFKNISELYRELKLAYNE